MKENDDEIKYDEKPKQYVASGSFVVPTPTIDESTVSIFLYARGGGTDARRKDKTITTFCYGGGAGGGKSNLSEVQDEVTHQALLESTTQEHDKRYQLLDSESLDSEDLLSFQDDSDKM